MSTRKERRQEAKAKAKGKAVQEGLPGAAPTGKRVHKFKARYRGNEWQVHSSRKKMALLPGALFELEYITRSFSGIVCATLWCHTSAVTIATVA